MYEFDEIKFMKEGVEDESPMAVYGSEVKIRGFLIV